VTLLPIGKVSGQEPGTNTIATSTTPGEVAKSNGGDDDEESKFNSPNRGTKGGVDDSYTSILTDEAASVPMELLHVGREMSSSALVQI
jgi:hypothetical protein